MGCSLPCSFFARCAVFSSIFHVQSHIPTPGLLDRLTEELRKHFSLEQAECRLDSDRALVLAAIKYWYETRLGILRLY